MARVNQEQYIKIIENNRKISDLLNENETMIRNAGFEIPNENYTVDKESKIKFPKGYIRTSGAFWRKYHLEELVESRNVRKNISYALQLSDYYNYHFNRFNIWGSVETMLYKQAFINIIAIIEALIMESVSRINDFCKMCPNIGKCKKNISKKERDNMKNAAEKLVALGILDLDNHEMNRLIDMYDYRNRIHIRLDDQNEFLDNKYTVDLYNKAIYMLQKVDDDLWHNAVPYYNLCMGFERKE